MICLDDKKNNDGEMNLINCELDKLKQMIQYLIYNKYFNNKSTTDKEFLTKTKITYSRYFC